MVENTPDEPIRILLVEDDEDDYVLTRGLLQAIFKNQFTLAWARGFDEGLARIVQELFDVALVDYRLGARNGVELIREARQAGSHLPIILLTGQDDRQVDLAAAEAGASDYLSKAEVRSASLERSIRYSIQGAKVEEQRVRLLAERAARAEAEAGNRAKDRFLATLSHELRTPLTPVMMAVTAMSNEESLPETVRQDLDMIRRNIELEARLIDDLLDITRLSRGLLQLRKAPVDLHVKLQEALSLCDADIQLRKHTIRQNLAASCSQVVGDPGRVQQILWNLLSNAARFTPHGGTVEIASANDEGSIIVTVSDNGVGIPPGLLPRLFDAFEQGARAAPGEVNGGLGLGLAISKALADLHGASLSAHSDGPDRGSIFTLKFPTAEPAIKAASPHSVLPSGGQQAAGDGRRRQRILFVEDHLDTAMALMRVLKSSGFEVEQARTVADAVGKIAAGSFDLLISDIGLPDGTGLDVMRAVRESQKPFPGIAVSGYGMSEDIDSARQAGFEHHLTKPVHPDVLIETARAAVK